MSKSKGNVIELRFSEDQVNKAVMSMYTDPKRLKATDPGTVEGNPLFQYHDAFNTDKEKVEDFKKRYRDLLPSTICSTIFLFLTNK